MCDNFINIARISGGKGFQPISVNESGKWSGFATALISASRRGPSSENHSVIRRNLKFCDELLEYRSAPLLSDARHPSKVGGTKIRSLEIKIIRRASPRRAGRERRFPAPRHACIAPIFLRRGVYPNYGRAFVDIPARASDLIPVPAESVESISKCERESSAYATHY